MKRGSRSKPKGPLWVQRGDLRRNARQRARRADNNHPTGCALARCSIPGGWARRWCKLGFSHAEPCGLDG